MNDFDQSPGGGFSSVGGYNDPAGSQAEQQRQMQEDEARRQQMEQAANDAAQIAAAEQTARNQEQTARNQEQAARDQSAQADSAGSNRGRNSWKAANKPASRSPAKHRPTTRASPSKPQEINSFFAILGFVGAGLWGMSLLEDDGRWFSGLVVGLIGAHIAGYYHKVILAGLLLGGGLWCYDRYESTREETTTAETQSSFDSVVGAQQTVQQTAIKESMGSSNQKPRDSFQPMTARQRIEALHPYPAMPTLLTKPHQPLTDDPSRMRDFQQMIFAFEKKTGKSFLTDHRSMKPPTRSRFDFIATYSSDGLQEGDETISSLQPIQGVWGYQSPQLWELDLQATVNQDFTYQTRRANGTVREGVFRTYSGDGLCYLKHRQPVIRGGDRLEDFRSPVNGGEIWRDFVTSVYHAKSDAELLALDPINQAVTKTHREIAEAKQNHQVQRRFIDGLRKASFSMAESERKAR